jgi:beta-glucosidase
VTIPAGGSKKVAINVKGEELGLWSIKNQWVVEPGDFLVRVGTSDSTFANATLTVS